MLLVEWQLARAAVGAALGSADAAWGGPVLRSRVPLWTADSGLHALAAELEIAP